MMSLFVGPGECNALFITNAGETHSIQEGYIEELTRFSQRLNAKTGFGNF